jgi:hypothetical protein
MAEMTVTPVATHGFFLDGKWLEEGDIVDIRAPYDGALIAHVTADAANTPKPPLPPPSRLLAPPAACPPSSASEFSARSRPAFTIAKKNSPTPLRSKRASPSRARALKSIAPSLPSTSPPKRRFATTANTLPLDWQQSTAGRWGIVKRFPLGPVAGITPFNFPLNLVAHKVAPAIAAGCSMVLKPAPETPLTSLLLAEVIQQAGWPDGGFNAVAALERRFRFARHR